jgi:DNA-binding transcriptional MerR regulator
MPTTKPDGGKAGGSPMFAGEVARRLDLGVQTLHYYEREGLIPETPRSEAGYRLFSPELVGRVAFIKKAQALGLPLAEIREILKLADEGACPCGHVQRSLDAKLREVDDRLRELRSFRNELAALVAQAPVLETTPGARVCAIVEKAHAPSTRGATRVLLQRRRS